MGPIGSREKPSRHVPYCETRNFIQVHLPSCRLKVQLRNDVIRQFASRNQKQMEVERVRAGQSKHHSICRSADSVRTIVKFMNMKDNFKEQQLSKEIAVSP